MREPLKVLFVCSGNCSLARMAEALGSAVGRGLLKCRGMGTSSDDIHPLAVRAMAEVGIDISQRASPVREQCMDERFDLVITLCERGRAVALTQVTWSDRIRWTFVDPSEGRGTEDEQLRAFRRVRDELRQRIQLFLLANRITARVSPPLRLVRAV